MPDSGVITIGPSVKVVYLPQIVTFENPEQTMLEIVQRSLK